MDNVNFGMNQLHWIAGLVEGEGCFYFRTRRVKGVKTTWRFKKTGLIIVGMTDKDVIIRLAQLWNGSIRTQLRGRDKTFYITNVCGNKAIGWMMTLYPLMGKRRQEKIKEIIKEWKGDFNGPS